MMFSRGVEASSIGVRAGRTMTFSLALTLVDELRACRRDNVLCLRLPLHLPSQSHLVNSSRNVRQTVLPPS